MNDNELRRKALMSSIGAYGGAAGAADDGGDETDPIRSVGDPGPTIELPQTAPNPMDASNGGITGAGLPTPPGGATLGTGGASPLQGPASPAGGSPYRDGSTVKLAGWDGSRTDNTGKYEFGRAVQQAQGRGEKYDADWVRKFVGDNSNEWELDPRSSANDPHIRQKQSWLDDPANGDGKSGHTSIYQDVLGDAGGANRPQFGNVEGDPALGYEAAPSDGGHSEGGHAAADGHGAGGYALDDALSGDPLAKIQQMIQQLSGARPNFAALLSELGRQ